MLSEVKTREMETLQQFHTLKYYFQFTQCVQCEKEQADGGTIAGIARLDDVTMNQTPCAWNHFFFSSPYLLVICVASIV